MAPARSRGRLVRTTLARQAGTTFERAATRTRMLLPSPGPFADMDLHFAQGSAAGYAEAHRCPDRCIVEHLCQYLRIRNCAATRVQQDVAYSEPGCAGRPFRLDADKHDAAFLTQCKLLFDIAR